MYRKLSTVTKPIIKSCASCKFYLENGEYCNKFTKIESTIDARAQHLLCGSDAKFYEYHNHKLDKLKKDLKRCAVISTTSIGVGYLAGILAPQYGLDVVLYATTGISSFGFVIQRVYTFKSTPKDI